MKPVDMTNYQTGVGDCFRACVSSIFEFEITCMPNFWDETQESVEFWKKVNEWMQERLSYKAILIEVGNEDFYIKDLLCIAIGTTDRGNEEHAVVWKNEMVHDPHPLRIGINKTTAFVIFAPLEPFLR